MRSSGTNTLVTKQPYGIRAPKNRSRKKILPNPNIETSCSVTESCYLLIQEASRYLLSPIQDSRRYHIIEDLVPTTLPCLELLEYGA